MESEEIIKTKINLITIGLFIVGTCLFGYFAYVVLNSEMKVAEGTSEKDALFVKWIIFGIFLFFSIVSLYNIVGLKMYSLTKKDLVVNQPLLLIKKVIPFETIDKIFEKNIQINMSRGLSNVASYKGKETILELTNGKKIKFDSLAIKNYVEFKKTISNLITQYNREQPFGKIGVLR